MKSKYIFSNNSKKFRSIVFSTLLSAVFFSALSLGTAAFALQEDAEIVTIEFEGNFYSVRVNRDIDNFTPYTATDRPNHTYYPNANDDSRNDADKFLSKIKYTGPELRWLPFAIYEQKYFFWCNTPGECQNYKTHWGYSNCDNHPEQCYLNLLVNGKVASTAVPNPAPTEDSKRPFFTIDPAKLKQQALYCKAFECLSQWIEEHEAGQQQTGECKNAVDAYFCKGTGGKVNCKCKEGEPDPHNCKNIDPQPSGKCVFDLQNTLDTRNDWLDNCKHDGANQGDPNNPEVRDFVGEISGKLGISACGPINYSDKLAPLDMDYCVEYCNRLNDEGLPCDTERPDLCPPLGSSSSRAPVATPPADTEETVDTSRCSSGNWAIDTACARGYIQQSHLHDQPNTIPIPPSHFATGTAPVGTPSVGGDNGGFYGQDYYLNEDGFLDMDKVNAPLDVQSGFTQSGGNSDDIYFQHGLSPEQVQSNWY